jgi:hypothetical protein
VIERDGACSDSSHCSDGGGGGTTDLLADAPRTKADVVVVDVDDDVVEVADDDDVARLDDALGGAGCNGATLAHRSSEYE